MPSPKSSPLGSERVRVVACFVGMGFLLVPLAAIWFVPNGWVIAIATPYSAAIFIYSAHTLHTGTPPQLRLMLQHFVDVFKRSDGK